MRISKFPERSCMRHKTPHRNNNSLPLNTFLQSRPQISKQQASVKSCSNTSTAPPSDPLDGSDKGKKILQHLSREPGTEGQPRGSFSQGKEKAHQAHEQCFVVLSKPHSGGAPIMVKLTYGNVLPTDDEERKREKKGKGKSFGYLVRARGGKRWLGLPGTPGRWLGLLP